MSPVQPPTADELLQSQSVIEALELAWIDSNTEDKNFRHEEGGWIYMDLATGDLSVERAPSGESASIDLGVTGRPHLTPLDHTAG
jgi:hypothetical protein